MGMEAAMMFQHQMRENLKHVLTALDMEKVEKTVLDILCNFDITAKEAGGFANDMLLDAYTDALRVEGRCESTITRYRYVIKKLMKFTGVGAKHMTVYHIRKYMGAEKERGIADSSLNGERQIFNTFFTWLHREGLIDINPMQNIGPIKCEKKIRLPFNDVEIEQLKRACETKRDRAIITFLLATGCRINEMVQLNRHDVDMNQMECKVFGKGKKERRVYLDPVAGMALKEYLLEREEEGDDRNALFAGRFGERLKAGGVRVMMKKLGKAAGVKHVHPHKFRRTLATNLIKHGMPIQEVSAILGHAKLDTTMTYIVLDQSQVKNDYLKYA
ncbi:MAG: tyrosine-type recombinase/integrase [Clostridia bacterium]|nr:tyrosine-type recombinase/integrase [Clostridia bacterium]